jgi:hypothetical protein
MPVLLLLQWVGRWTTSSSRLLLVRRKTGKDGGTTTAFDTSNNQIAAGAAGLTLAKLIEAKEILDSNDVDPSIPRYIAVSPKQITNLLDDPEVTSADYNTVRALVKGELDTYVGFKFVTTNRLGLDGSGDRRCFAWAMDGIKLAVGKEPTARIDERADKSVCDPGLLLHVGRRDPHGRGQGR